MIAFKAHIEQLPQNRNGYAYFEVEKRFVDQLPKQHKTRVICTIDEFYKFQCGFAHLGNGNCYIILAKTRLKELNKAIGDSIEVSFIADPNKLGAAIPESLQVLLDQDDALMRKFETFTDGMKRNLIRYVSDTKNLDLQVDRAIYMLNKYAKG